MTYFDLKELCKKIDTQKLKVQEVKEQAYKTTSTVSETQGSGTAQDKDKLGAQVCRIDEEEIKQKALELELEQAFCKIPNEHIRNAIICKLKYGWSWNKIAMALGGNNTDDSVRKMCTRYSW